MLTGLVVATAGWAAAPRAFHFGLRTSAPEADAVVEEAPTEVRLWFTEVPQENSVAVRLLDAASDPIETGDLVQDEEDARAFAVPVASTLEAGAYTVVWRGVGADGHVVRGDFSFTVATGRE